MMLFDRKKAMNQIMGSSPEEEGPKEHPAHIAAKEAIDAIHAKDHVGFANATKAMMMAHEGEGNASEDHE